MKILISSCLLGCKCRYDGNSQKQNELHKLIDSNYIIPFCPEQAAGLPTRDNAKTFNTMGVYKQI